MQKSPSAPPPHAGLPGSSRRLGKWAPLAAAGVCASYGGKAASLARLAAAGLPVPDGIALDPDLVEGVATGAHAHREQLRMALEGVPSSLRTARVAVRSSAIDEDGGNASFAGQHATHLGVPAELEAIARAVSLVWKSAHEPSALAYRARLGLSTEPRMAVVVQTLVESDVAGVAFSRHPVTGADEIVIECSWGLGEAVVAGLVTPDHVRVARHGGILERRPGWKDVAVRVVDGGVAERPVAEELIEALAATDVVVAQVVALVRRCEETFGGPQDVEWAMVAGRLHCLQSRPVTRAGAASTASSAAPRV